MPMGTYKYTDDGGRTYQLVLPDDFATAMNYQAADPADSYIPVGISPRYASYVVPGGRQFREVVVTDPTTFANLPSPVTADGATWQLAAAIGESFMQLPGGNLRVIAGPQGVPGADAEISYNYAALAADVALNSSNQDFTLATISSLPAGTYLVFATVQFQTGAAATRFTAAYKTSAGPTKFGSVSVHGATASAYYEAVITSVITISAGQDLILVAQATTTSAFARENSATGEQATVLLAVKIA